MRYCPDSIAHTSARRLLDVMNHEQAVLYLIFPVRRGLSIDNSIKSRSNKSSCFRLLQSHSFHNIAIEQPASISPQAFWIWRVGTLLDHIMDYRSSLVDDITINLCRTPSNCSKIVGKKQWAACARPQSVITSYRRLAKAVLCLCTFFPEVFLTKSPLG